MELVLSNPFRVLGLSATASSRDIAKRISDLETYAELGKSKSFPFDLLVLGPIDRSLTAIEDAARKIEQTEGRLFHSFFWFRIGDSVDELALESLANENYQEAIELWLNQLGRPGSKKYTWRLNLCVLHFINACRDQIDTDVMNDALELLGFIIDDELDESVKDVLSGNESGFDRKSVWIRVIDEIALTIQSSPNSPYGTNAIKVLDSLWSFPAHARAYAAAKILNPLIEQINDAIKISEELRAIDNFESLMNKNNLEQIEHIVLELQNALGEDDIRFQTIANAYSNEICSCAVKALNEFKKPKLSMELIQWADGLPSYSRIKFRITENLETIQGWLEDDEDELFEEIVKKLKVNVYTLTQASSLLEDMKLLLADLKNRIGGNDKRYLSTSSACAHHILGFLIDAVNSAQNTFENTKNLNDLSTTMSGALTLTRKLLFLDLDAEARSRVNQNLEMVAGMNDRLISALNARSNESNESGGLLEIIPGWIWIVGIILLLSMCIGK